MMDEERANLLAEASRFLMQCQACGCSGVPQVLPGDPMLGVHQFLALHGFGRCSPDPRYGPLVVVPRG